MRISSASSGQALVSRDGGYSREPLRGRLRTPTPRKEKVGHDSDHHDHDHRYYQSPHRLCHLRLRRHLRTPLEATYPLSTTLRLRLCGLLSGLGTPASAPKSRGRSSGQPKISLFGRAKCYLAIKKAAWRHIQTGIYLLPQGNNSHCALFGSQIRRCRNLKQITGKTARSVDFCEGLWPSLV